MCLADKNLRNRTPAAARGHFLAKLCIVVHIDLVDYQILGAQKSFGSLAVRAPAREIHGDRWLSHFALALPPEVVFVSGKLSLTQAFKPPSKLKTLVKPSLVSVRAAPAPPLPLSS